MIYFYFKGLQLGFNEPSKFFTCNKAGVSPGYKIKQVQLYVMAGLLKPAALLKIETRLASGTLQIPFQNDVVKSYRYTSMNITCQICTLRNLATYTVFIFSFSIETGHLQHEINLSLKSPFQSCIVIMHKNVNLGKDIIILYKFSLYYLCSVILIFSLINLCIYV